LQNLKHSRNCKTWARHGVALLLVLALSACNPQDDPPATSGTSSGVGNTPQTYELNGSVTGLSRDGLVLLVGSTAIAVESGAGSVALATGLSSGTAYSVTVQTQPAGETCSVANGMGMIRSANVGNVVITCAAQANALGGTITGLTVDGLVLANGADRLAVPAHATAFTLATAVAYGSAYQVTVQTQPAGLACAVSQGSGVMPDGPVTSVTVSCTSEPFTLSGTIAGLGNHVGLVLANGADSLSVAANVTAFTLPTPVDFGSTYAVTVTSAPAGLTCSVTNGSGAMPPMNVSNIVVTCANRAYALGGTITGLTHAGLVLANGSDTLAVAANAATFTMSAAVPYGATYHVTVQTQPVNMLCTVNQGDGTMPDSDVTDLTVNCSVPTYTIGGTITGLTMNGLVLLNDGGDATAIAPNATQFTMNTGVAAGSSYAVAIGTQPYGISLSCTVSGAAGTAGSDVTTVAVSCGSSTPAQSLLLGYFYDPFSMAVDGEGNVYVADRYAQSIKKVPYANGVYGMPTVVAAGFNAPSGVGIDAGGNLYVADEGANAVLQVPYVGGGYGTPVTLGSGYSSPYGLTLDSSGNVYVADTGNSVVKKISYSNGVFGSPAVIASGFQFVYAVAVDPSGNVWAPDNNNNAVKEVPFSNGSYGTPVTVGSGWQQPDGIAVDPSGNVYVADTHNTNGPVKMIPFSNGSYGAPLVIASGLYPYAVTVDGSGNVFAGSSGSGQVYRISNSNGTWYPPVALGAGLDYPHGLAVDGNRNLYVADTNSQSIKMFSYANGSYGAATTLATGFSAPRGVACDPAGNLFVADTNHNAVKEIPHVNGTYGTPVTLGSGFSRPYALALDASGNVFVADSQHGAVKEIPLSNGSYGTPVTLASGLNFPQGVAVDGAGNIFVTDSNNNVVREIPLTNGTYGTAVTVASGFSSPNGIGVDASGNLYVADTAHNALQWIPYSNGVYGTAVSIGSGFKFPQSVAVDFNGRVYVADYNAIQIFAPPP
jgi:sugar lactone lactonase YvrE